MIKNLIFDLGDVLMEYRATEMLMDYGLSREEALALDDLMFYDPLWAILDKGTMTNEEVIAGYAKKYPAGLSVMENICMCQDRKYGKEYMN